MKNIVFDTGPIISLTVNNLLWILEPLKKLYSGDFCIPESVKKELIDRPLETKRFKFEALQVLRYVDEGIIKIIRNDDTKHETLKLLEIANNCFKAHGHHINIVHYAEMAGLACCLKLNSDAFVVDERTTRVLVESPDKLVNILRNKLHTQIETNKANLKEFKNMTKGIKLIRSAEIVTVAYEKKMLDK